MIAKIAVFFAAVSVVYAQGGPQISFCQEKLVKEVRAGKKANFYANVMHDQMYSSQPENQCKVRCQLYISGKEGSSQENYGEYQAPDYSRCGMSQQSFCKNGKCDGNSFCREKMDKEVKELLEKKGMYPMVTFWPKPNAKPCEVYCNMTADQYTVTKMFHAFDYANCGSEDDGLMNICKAGKCVTPDGKKPKSPQPIYGM